MGHDERVVWLLDDVVEVEGLSWSIQIWVIAHDFKESKRLKSLISWDDGEWFTMIEWGDCQRALMITTEHQWEFSHDFREIDMIIKELVFSIGHVKSWKHDVRGYGQRIGGYHFMSLFILSPLHTELPIASPLSLTRAP